MAGKQQTSDVRPRVDASSTRLPSFRASTDTSANGSTRRPKFVPKAAKRRPVPETGRGEDVGTGATRSHDAKPHLTGAGALKHDDRGRNGGRGAGRGRGRGRGIGFMPSGKVAFVGTLSSGSSFGGGGSTAAPRATSAYADYSAAGGTGISVLDEAEMPGGKILVVEEEHVWPPVVKSVMEPMSLPIVRPPEPDGAGAIFCDPSGDMVAMDDSLFFIQMPTTLPLSSVVTKTTKTDEDDPMGSAEDVNDEEAKKTKENTNPDDSPDDGVFDHSVETAPGGYIGKICVHKSGKMVLMLGDKQFDVAAAQTPSFCEEIYAVNTTEKQLSILGNVERHLVVTPDFDVLLH
uniref:DNA-directed RNA polymerase III subunit RPC4 n=1 Tax=Peronospora matthiolae TaxID=2874970 RepID=A0AAV1V4K6_9STRA